MVKSSSHQVPPQAINQANLKSSYSNKIPLLKKENSGRQSVKDPIIKDELLVTFFDKGFTVEKETQKMTEGDLVEQNNS